MAKFIATSSELTHSWRCCHRFLTAYNRTKASWRLSSLFSAVSSLVNCTKGCRRIIAVWSPKISARGLSFKNWRNWPTSAFKTESTLTLLILCLPRLRRSGARLLPLLGPVFASLWNVTLFLFWSASCRIITNGRLFWVATVVSWPTSHG